MKTVALIGLILASTGAASAATIQNGSFEDPGTFSGNWQTQRAGSNGLPGWTIGGAGVDLIGNYWGASEGNYSLDMSAGRAGSLSTTISDLVAGQAYFLTFDMAANSAGGNKVKSLSVIVDGVAKDYSFDSTGKSRLDMGWETRTFRFVATSDTASLTLRSNENNAYGAALDNVQVSAVPLPAAGFALGLGLLSFGGLRARRG
ncbi:MAG: choice-of-anchor C family protein [Pseudomonadota bacterium]